MVISRAHQAPTEGRHYRQQETAPQKPKGNASLNLESGAAAPGVYIETTRRAEESLSINACGGGGQTSNWMAFGSHWQRSQSSDRQSRKLYKTYENQCTSCIQIKKLMRCACHANALEPETMKGRATDCTYHAVGLCFSSSHVSEALVSLSQLPFSA